MTTQETVAAATRRQWGGLVVLLLPTLLLTADLGVLWLAVPALAADLGSTSTELLWINDAYGFATAPLLVVMGSLGDRFGRRRVLLLGAAGFLAASLLATFAVNPLMLIAARALLGASGAAILPSTLGLISSTFHDPRQRRIAVAAWVTALSTGIGIGPVIGGLMLSHWWWGSLFLVGVPAMAITLGLVPLLIRESRDPIARRLDLVSVPLFVLTILPLVFAIKWIGEHGFDLLAAALLLLSAGSGVVFVRRQTRTPAPLLDLKLFTNPVFRAALILLFLGLTAMNGVEYLVPQYLLSVAGASPIEAGLWLIPPAAALALGSQFTPIVARRIGPGRLIAIGAAIALLGLAGLLLGSTSALLVSTSLSVVMLGLAPITVLGTDLAVGSAPSSRSSSAAAIGQTSYELGLAFGIAIIGSIVSIIYRAHVLASAPANLLRQTVETVSDNYGGGLTIASQVGDEFARLVQAAFVSGFQAAALASATIAVALGVTALLLLRRTPSTNGGGQ